MGILKGDFIGFTFNNIHSSALGIIRTSDGDRFNMNLLPSFQDSTSQVNGVNGTYYWKSDFKQRQFSIPIAFDSLSEAQLRELTNVFQINKICPLIFDESPYKEYMVKLTREPQLKVICFDGEDDERIYKGEGTLEFTAFFPFARNRHIGEFSYKFLDMYNSYDRKDSSGKIISYALPEWEGFTTNENEWAGVCGMKDSKGNYDVPGESISLFNPGDRETDFLLQYSMPASASNYTITLEDKSEILLGKLEIVGLVAQTEDSFFRLNSKNQLIEGLDSNKKLTGNLYNKYLTGGTWFKIPKGESTINCATAATSIEYDYLYY